MKLNPKLAPEYEAAADAAVLQQFVLGFGSYFLDHFYHFSDLFAQIIFVEGWALSAITFWGIVLWIVLRRRLSPSRVDLGLIKFGFMLLGLFATGSILVTAKIHGLI